jgi:hypothetical protein
MIKQHREVPDLIQLIADLNKRVGTLESANSLGNASIDGGELTVRGGDIVVRNSNDEEVLRIAHGTKPKIVMHPDAGLDDFYSMLFSWESVSQGAAIQASIYNSSDDQDGGKLLLMRNAAYLSHQPDSAEETYIALSEHDAFNNHISFKGLFLQSRIHGDEPWEMGYDSIGAGFGAISYAFAYPYDQVPQIIYSISGATANFNHCVVSPSTTGFTIGWSDALAHTVSWVAIRR